MEEAPLCLEFVVWKPSRKHSKDRSPTLPVIGITNYDKCHDIYWAIAEVDKDIPLKQLLDSIPVWVGRPLLVLRTTKGYHVYLDFASHNPLKVFHTLMKAKVFDRGHLKLARARSDERLKNKLILRISPKYHPHDIFPVLIRKPLPLWHNQVLTYLAMYQTIWWEHAKKKIERVSSMEPQHRDTQL